LGMDDPPEEGDVGPTHWNPQVRAYFSTSSDLQDDAERRSALRSLGFGAALAVPRLGIFRGQAAVIDLSDGNVRERIIRPDLVQSVAFSRTGQLGGSYPNSPMGAIALIRQTLLDADWYERAWDAYEASGRSFLPPERSEALGSLEGAIHGTQPFLFEARREEEHLRTRAIADEFPEIRPWVRGNGAEYRLLDVLRGSDVPLIVPIDFPDAPEIESAEDALDEDLDDLRHWYLAPENPARLAGAGVSFAVTTDGLAEDDDFLPNLRAAVARGWSRDDALASLTTVPAAMLGIEGTHGTIQPGKVANLVVVEGDLFEDGSIRDVWVEGDAYDISIPPRVDPRGTWVIATTDGSAQEARLQLEGTLNRLRGSIEIGGTRVDLESASARTEAGRIQVSFDAEPLGLEGVAQLSASIDDGTLYGWGMFPDGTTTSWEGERVETFAAAEGAGPARDVPDLDLPDLRPAMAYGIPALPEQPEWVVVRNATVWTQGPQGRIENADLLVQAGEVVEVGSDLEAPSGAVEIDATGKHVTPGLIDPHIHSGTDGTNESGFAIVPEVRMADVVTHNNIWVYRQLAGGLTTAHIKHGSANPIGGQNVFVKMRWGALPDELKLDDPPRTVKFALGENPKRRS
ncbi:MAG TPA: amidohydrolase family protein, partial [Longimicrobiales bacterium]|nr:amidohydrolase family protein [Longimicrobiales bacterium]